MQYAENRHRMVSIFQYWPPVIIDHYRQTHEGFKKKRRGKGIVGVKGGIKKQGGTRMGHKKEGGLERGENRGY